MLGVGGTLSKNGTVTVPHSVKCNIRDWLPNVSQSTIHKYSKYFI